MYIFVTLDLLLPIDHDIQKRKKTKTDFFRVIISEGRGFKYLNSDLINVLNTRARYKNGISIHQGSRGAFHTRARI